MITENYDYNAALEFNPNTGVYNLFITTFNGDVINRNFFFFFCDRKHGARLDLVSSDIYGSTKWTGTLCQLNNMFHPHQVREGDVLLYLSEDDMESLGEVPESIKQSTGLASRVKSELINALKKRRPDPSRKKFQDNRPDTDVLPPNVLPDNAPQIQVNNNKIKVAPNLFNNPNTAPTEPVETTSTTTPQNPPNTEDQVERILVRRYIRSVND